MDPHIYVDPHVYVDPHILRIRIRILTPEYCFSKIEISDFRTRNKYEKSVSIIETCLFPSIRYNLIQRSDLFNREKYNINYNNNCARILDYIFIPTDDWVRPIKHFVLEKICI